MLYRSWAIFPALLKYNWQNVSMFEVYNVIWCMYVYIVNWLPNSNISVAVNVVQQVELPAMPASLHLLPNSLQTPVGRQQEMTQVLGPNWSSWLSPGPVPGLQQFVSLPVYHFTFQNINYFENKNFFKRLTYLVPALSGMNYDLRACQYCYSGSQVPVNVANVIQIIAIW